MDTNGNERYADLSNGAYYNGSACIQLTSEECTFHQVNYQGYTSILGATSRSNVKANVSQAGSVIITFESDKWGYLSGNAMKRGDFDLPVQGTYSSTWIKVGGIRYDKSTKEADENDE